MVNLETEIKGETKYTGDREIHKKWLSEMWRLVPFWIILGIYISVLQNMNLLCKIFKSKIIYHSKYVT